MSGNRIMDIIVLVIMLGVGLEALGIALAAGDEIKRLKKLQQNRDEPKKPDAR